MLSIEFIKTIEFLKKHIKNFDPQKDISISADNKIRLHTALNEMDMNLETWGVDNKDLRMPVKIPSSIVSIDGTNWLNIRAVYEKYILMPHVTTTLKGIVLPTRNQAYLSLESYDDIIPSEYIHGAVNLSNVQPDDNKFKLHTKLIDYRKNPDLTSWVPVATSRSRDTWYTNVDMAVLARSIVLTSIDENFPYVHGNITLNLCMDHKQIKEAVMNIIRPKMTTFSTITIFDANNRLVSLSHTAYEDIKLSRGTLDFSEYESIRAEILNLK